MGPIVLAKDFSFVAAAGQTLRGDWIELGDLSRFQDGMLHVHCQTLDPTGGPFGLAVDVATSFDGVEHDLLGSTLTVTAVGSFDQAILGNMAEMVRVELTNSTAGLLMGIVSVWLQLVSD